MKQYFDENGRHYFTDEEKEALQNLISHLEQSYKEFWEQKNNTESEDKKI